MSDFHLQKLNIIFFKFVQSFQMKKFLSITVFVIFNLLLIWFVFFSILFYIAPEKADYTKLYIGKASYAIFISLLASGISFLLYLLLKNAISKKFNNRKVYFYILVIYFLISIYSFLIFLFG